MDIPIKDIPLKKLSTSDAEKVEAVENVFSIFWEYLNRNFAIKSTDGRGTSYYAMEMTKLFFK